MVSIASIVFCSFYILNFEQLSPPLAGNGRAEHMARSIEPDELIARRYESNANILSRLREDPNSSSPFESCMKDAELGRMSYPRPLTDRDLYSLNLSPRFGVEQGFAF